MKMMRTKFDNIKVRKFELGLQERIDTGLVPSFYTFISIYASTVADLKSETDIRPELLTWLGMGYVRHKKKDLMIELEQRIRDRIKEQKANNGGSITNAEIGRIRIEESVKTMANIIGLFDEKYEKRQTIGLLIAPEDMKNLDAPPIITDLNSCEDELREMGVKIEEAGRVEEGSDYSDGEYTEEEVNEEE